MTDSNYTHILVIVDRSGSMRGYDADMRGALNQYFEDQAKEDGVCLVDYVQFDDKYEVVFTDREVGEAKAVLHPRGATALLDAVGRAVTDLGRKLRNMSEARRPGKVLVVVVTDGYENASREWTRAKIADLIAEQENKWNWTFTFLGANMDAVAVGQSFGFQAGNSITYDQSYAGTVAVAAALSSNTTNYRSGGSFGYTEDERAESMLVEPPTNTGKPVKNKRVATLP